MVLMQGDMVRVRLTISVDSGILFHDGRRVLQTFAFADVQAVTTTPAQVRLVTILPSPAAV
jgi:hypothetical protein